jgi:hypothetical protein
MKDNILIEKCENIIYFEELPRNIQHALEILVEWHSVLVYQQSNGRYGFTILDVYMPNGSDFTDLIESKYVNAHHYIQKSIQKIIDTEYNGVRCAYFPKGNLSSNSHLLLGYMISCDIHAGYGFSIEVHSNDYGFLDEERSKIAPAHAHVLDKDGLEIGLLNICGPCPKKISDVKEFRPPHEFGDPEPMKKTHLLKHRKNIVKWANVLIHDQIPSNLWELTQQNWISLHEESLRW